MMSTEKEKMLNGQLYDARDEELTLERKKARQLLHRLNVIDYGNEDKYSEITRELFPNSKSDIWIEPPFFCDYGYNIIAGENVFFNFNCVVLDVMPVKIGRNVLFGPNVQIYTATHPINYRERRKWLESAKAITIGDDCWIGGGAIICPGVTIGNRTIIGAGSVVTKDIGDDVIAVGNPCKVIKENINCKASK